ncbi:MAG: DUF424 domain-containing protein [Candidatus Aenigmatarchaeota archaeon]|jgi:hypothetical protein
MPLKNEFWCKVIKTKFDFLVAICDKDLLGKSLEVEKGLKIKISERFYKEKIIDEREAITLMKKATIGNLFGENIVKLAVENNFISEENIIYIDGVPHAQFVKI